MSEFENDIGEESPVVKNLAIDITIDEPVDHYNIVYLIFLLFGIGVLLPWNAVLTAMPYFQDQVFPSIS